jgi:hypothetical protein
MASLGEFYHTVRSVGEAIPLKRHGGCVLLRSYFYSGNSNYARSQSMLTTTS